MKRTNPALRADLYSRFRDLPLDPAGQMTEAGTLNKTLFLVAVAAIMAALNFFMCYSIPSVGIGATIGGVLVGLGVCLLILFKPEQSALLAPIYATAEGLFLGGVSALYNYRYSGAVQMAVPLTFCVLFAMLVLYRTGAIQATQQYVKVIFLCTLGIGLFGVLNLIRFLVTGESVFVAGSPISIAIALFICVIAALNFVIDFEFVRQGTKEGAPQYMEWYGAFAICVTLFWLYLQILRLLRLLRR